MNRSHEEQPDSEAKVAEWIKRSASNGSARAFAMLQLPLRDTPTHQPRPAWKKLVVPKADPVAEAARAAEAVKSALDEMEDMADLYLAAGHFYSDAGLKQLRTLRSLKKLVAMRQFKMKSMALREEIAQKYVH